jgi:hypothetical protein
MRVVFVLAFLAMLSIAVNAYCPNLCSGHGSCGSNDKCTCYTQKGTASGFDGGAVAIARAAWTGADCSLRTCPVAVSWVGATPTGAAFGVNTVDVAGGGNAPHKIVTLQASGANNKVTTDCSAAGGEIVPATQYKKGDKIQVFHKDSGSLYFEYTVYSITCASNVHTIITYEQIDTTISGSATNGDFVVHFAGRDDDAANTLAKPATARGVHGILECSGAGKCNRETGECECFDGYGGEACARTVCPSDCSGHGICVSMETLVDEAAEDYSTQFTLFDNSGATAVSFGSATMKKYNGWDLRKNFACKCDAGFRGPDCSQQECPSYLDPMKGCGGGSCNFQTGGAWGAILPFDVATATAAVDSLTGTTVIQYSKCANTATGCSSGEQRDCSGRGLCDYETGTCACFSGFYGEACEIQTILV